MTDIAGGDKSALVAEYLREVGWISQPFSARDVRFLAAGEYNENYLVDVGPGYVLRINHGSQLGLENQISYEFNVLKAIAPSGVTPEPYKLDARQTPMGRGVLLMRYLPGDAFNYKRDAFKAARTFARVHSLPVSSNLLVQADPVGGIAAESHGLLLRYAEHPLKELKPLLLRYHESIQRLAEDTRPLFADDPMVMVNTEVNSGNFIVSGEKAWLVDWEKAVVSSRYQDLGHFVVHTTTRWKTDFTFSERLKREFICAYLHAGEWDINLEEALYKTEVLEKTILLRALSWCYMAYYEYTRPGRVLTNRDTFSKIKEYLDGAECILA
ncbi:MAG: phosphotransferase family protein [Desulfovibrio sp.]|uniref:phosphotransferase family protein n=1 Tax=Desulfovibrio sp. 7SRBS1 TaxID=3378064 RepID=UPI003B3F3448